MVKLVVSVLCPLPLNQAQTCRCHAVSVQHPIDSFRVPESAIGVAAAVHTSPTILAPEVRLPAYIRLHITLPTLVKEIFRTLKVDGFHGAGRQSLTTVDDGFSCRSSCFLIALAGLSNPFCQGFPTHIVRAFQPIF